MEFSLICFHEACNAQKFGDSVCNHCTPIKEHLNLGPSIYLDGMKSTIDVRQPKVFFFLLIFF